MADPIPTPAADEADLDAAWERALLGRQIESLDRLAEMGMRLAASVERRATADEPPPENVLHHAALDFARVARAVRLTFALQSRLIADFKKPPARSADNTGPDDDDEDDEDDGGNDVFWLGEPMSAEERRRQVVRDTVKAVAQRAQLGSHEIERAESEAGERLENEAFCGDILNRPIGELVALICRDLGLEPDWSGFADKRWAQKEMADEPPGSPYVGWIAEHGPPPPLEVDWRERRLGKWARRWRSD